MSGVAFLGSWDPRWIEDHKNWLLNHGPHLDGWSNTIGEESQERLLRQVREFGFVHFYAYMATSKGGTGRVQHRLKCAELRFVDPPEPFRHGHGNHHDAEEWSARILFTVEDILDHPRGFELERFTTVAGKRIGKPQALMNLQVVHDIDGWTD